MSRRDFEVIIVGGGMVGAALACALGEHGVPVALIEGNAPNLDWPPRDFDLRVSAITRASQQIFANLGAWHGMTRRRVNALREMRVWDASGHGAIHFDSADLGEPYLGHIIENGVIQAALWERLTQIDAVTCLCPAAPASLAITDDAAHLTLGDGRTLRAALLVGADGAQSWVRAQAGIAADGWDYGHSALVATVTPERHHQDTAWQRFLPDGPLAFLPLPEGHCSIVWSTSPEHAAHLRQLDDAAFLATLHESFGDALGAIQSAGPRALFPLRLSHAGHYVQPRLALIGDAAHTLHPLAGQGVNLGLADAATLAQVLRAGRQRRRDLGDLVALRRYERWRKSENLLMMATMEAFKRLFGTHLAPARWARNTGLDLTDRLPLVKNLIMRRAMGLTGDLPELARPREVRN